MAGEILREEKERRRYIHDRGDNQNKKSWEGKRREPVKNGGLRGGKSLPLKQTEEVKN